MNDHDNVLLYDIAERQYHADRLGDDDAPPRLSASTAKDLILRSPLHAFTHHPRLGGVRGEASDAMENGTLIHALLLDKGRDIVGVEAKDWRTNDAKAAREEARSKGKIAVLADKLAAAENTAKLLRARMELQGLKLDGDSEVTAAWESDGVLCRGRFDHLIDGATIVEVKTCESGHPKAIQRAIESYGYDIGGAAYVEALATIRPEVAPRLVWAFVECFQPYSVTLVEFRGSMAELGRRRWARAKRLWSKCLATNQWPGYADGVIEVEASDFAISREALYDVSNV